MQCRFGARASLRAFYNGNFERARHVHVGGGRDLGPADVALQVTRLLEASGERPRRFALSVRSDTPAIRPLAAPLAR